MVAGRLSPIAAPVPQAITAAMSAQTFDAIGRGITGLVTTGDLEAALGPVLGWAAERFVVPMLDRALSKKFSNCADPPRPASP